MFGQLPPRDYTPVVGNDLMLLNIIDWRMFEEKVLYEPELAPPSFFLDREVECENWNNIPLPLVDAVNTLKRSFFNMENLLLSLVREQKSKCESTAKKIRMFEKRTNDDSDNIRRAQAH